MSKVRCVFCRKWFRPTRRRRRKQRACDRIKCRKKSDRRAGRRWRRKNRSYFKGRYPSLKLCWDYAGYLRAHRKEHPEYVAAYNRKRRARRRRRLRSGDIQHPVPRR
jgi:hypothetical protein